MHTITESRIARFGLGACRITGKARSVLLRNQVNFLTLLARHARGDWGDLDDEDAEANQRAVLYGGRIFSVYDLTATDRIYIITEADRSSTTLLLPSEY